LEINIALEPFQLANIGTREASSSDDIRVEYIAAKVSIEQFEL